MSQILSGKENFKPKPKPDALKTESSGSIVQGSIQTHGLFSGASIGVINIQNLCFPEAVSSRNQAPIASVSTAKKRRHVIYSSDEED